MPSVNVDSSIGDEEHGNSTECTHADSESDFDAPPISPISEGIHEADTDTGNDDSNAILVSHITVCAHPTAGNYVEIIDIL